MPKRLSYNDVKAYIESIEGYKLISTEYKNVKTKLLIQHKGCPKPFEMSYENFKNGYRCTICNCNKYQPNPSKGIDKYKKEIRDLFKDEYSILGDTYINNRSGILTRHNICGHEWSPRPDNLKAGYGCPKCKGGSTFTQEMFEEKVKEIYGDEYTVLGDYINNKTDILIRHNCDHCNNHEFKVRPSNFTSNMTQCPICSERRKESRGEKQIRRWLDKNNFIYYTEYKFDDCKDKQLLRFDFYVKLKDGNFKLIEYDGEQHFRATGFYPKEKVELIKKHDSMKNSYCKEKGIDLI